MQASPLPSAAQVRPKLGPGETLRQKPFSWLRSPSVTWHSRFVDPGTQKGVAQPGPLHTAHTARRKILLSFSSQSPHSLFSGLTQSALHWT